MPTVVFTDEQLEDAIRSLAEAAGSADREAGSPQGYSMAARGELARDAARYSDLSKWLERHRK